MSSGCLDVRKGTRIQVGIHEPVDLSACVLGDARQHLRARPMLPFLQLDEVLPAGASALCEPVVREVCFLTGAANAGGDQSQRRILDALFERKDGAHVAY